jgi:hypothetical protein
MYPGLLSLTGFRGELNPPPTSYASYTYLLITLAYPLLHNSLVLLVGMRKLPISLLLV